MPRNRQDEPSTLKRSPKKVRDTYDETLASAEAEYGGDEARAHRVAWGAVKNVAEKKGDHWEPKARTGPSDPHSKRSQKDKIAGKGASYGGIDVEGNTRDQLVDRAKRAGVTGYSRMNKGELAKALQRKGG